VQLRRHRRQRGEVRFRLRNTESCPLPPQTLGETRQGRRRLELVIRGDSLNVVDHQRLDLRLPLLKVQAERFANGCE
jgi:hypothetical protein